MVQFSQFQRNLAREKFLVGKHLKSSSTKMVYRINFTLCTYISNRLLHKTMPTFLLIRLQHMRHAMACTCLCTCLKHQRCAQKSMPCLIKKNFMVCSRSKTTTFCIFHFLQNTKILREDHNENKWYLVNYLLMLYYQYITVLLL